MKTRISVMEITANIHLEDGAYWADVPALPGCLASGNDLDELVESLREGVELYLREDESETELDLPKRALVLTSATLSDAVR
jgi:predicted RNase H-like HicB family nuclease